MSNWLQIIQKKTDNFQVQIADFLDSANLDVVFTFVGLSDTGLDYPTITSGGAKKMNMLPGSVGQQYLYVTQIGSEKFPKAGTYVGKIEATNPLVGNQIVYTQKVLINIVEPELASLSNVAIGDSYLNYGELLEFITNKNLSYPFPVSKNADGSETFTLYSDIQFPLVVSENRKPLPLGSYIKVYSKTEYNKSGRPQEVPVFNQLSPVLLWTNEDGTPRGFANAEPISNGQASYTYIGGLPKGEYFLQVYVNNKPIQTHHFSFPNQNCISKNNN